MLCDPNRRSCTVTSKTITSDRRSEGFVVKWAVREPRYPCSVNIHNNKLLARPVAVSDTLCSPSARITFRSPLRIPPYGFFISKVTCQFYCPQLSQAVTIQDILAFINQFLRPFPFPLFPYWDAVHPRTYFTFPTTPHFFKTTNISTSVLVFSPHLKCQAELKK